MLMPEPRTPEAEASFEVNIISTIQLYALPGYRTVPSISVCRSISSWDSYEQGQCDSGTVLSGLLNQFERSDSPPHESFPPPPPLPPPPPPLEYVVAELKGMARGSSSRIGDHDRRNLVLHAENKLFRQHSLLAHMPARTHEHTHARSTQHVHIERERVRARAVWLTSVPSVASRRVDSTVSWPPVRRAAKRHRFRQC